MIISHEKPKAAMNIRVNREILREVTNFSYLDHIIPQKSETEILKN